ERPGEARPAGARFELVERAEQRLAGHDVDVDPLLVVVPELVVERRLGALVLRDGILFGRQKLLQLRVGGLLERAEHGGGVVLRRNGRTLSAERRECGESEDSGKTS